MDLLKIKNLFLKVLIACLIAAGSLAVITVLVGKFSDTLSKALFTILIVAIHSLISFSFITNNEKQDTFENLSFFTNATFGVIVFSFITAVLGIWGILPGDLVAKLYGVYAVLLFAILHAEVLARSVDKQAGLDKLVYINYCFMIVVVVLLMPVIFTGFSSSLGGFYYRILAACGIVDATLTLVVAIQHKIYLQKHPHLKDPVFVTPLASGQTPGMQPVAGVAPQPKRGMNIFLRILIGLLILQLLGGLVLMVVGFAA